VLREAQATADELWGTYGMHPGAAYRTLDRAVREALRSPAATDPLAPPAPAGELDRLRRIEFAAYSLVTLAAKLDYPDRERVNSILEALREAVESTAEPTPEAGMQECGGDFDSHNWNSSASPTFCRRCRIDFPTWNQPTPEAES
jgi:hypothetical protein